jgi:hypothetical protein
LDQYPVFLQIGTHQGEGFPDKFVDVERNSVPGVIFGDRPNAFDSNWMTGAPLGDPAPAAAIDGGSQLRGVRWSG